MADNWFDLTGKVAVITGGAKGIGKGIAAALSKYGACSVIFDIDEKQAAETIAQIEEAGGKAAFKKVNVTNADEVNKTVSEIMDEFGRIDILVNNAGTVVRKSAFDTTEEEWDRVLELNLKSHFICAKAIAPHMIKAKKGKIIEIGSVSSFLGHPDHAAYAASKGGIRLLIKALTTEWSGYGINVNGIAPGYIRTPMTEPFLANEKNYAGVVSRIPMGRVGETEDVGRVAVFLASEASDYVSGELILVDGGRTVD